MMEPPLHERMGRYGGAVTKLKVSYWPGELTELVADAGPSTADDVSVTEDGRRLDTAEAVIAFFDELREG